MVRTRARSVVVGATLGAVLVAGCGDDGNLESQPVATSAGEESSTTVVELSLVGTWTGPRERIASTEGYRRGTATLTVVDQEGLTFTGTMSWSAPGGDQTEPLVGAFTPGGSMMAGADDEGVYTFEFVNPSTLDYCYVESGDGYRATCARLVKQG